MIDLRRLGHLVALADERHFARAAERVHLSQPAFSRSIQALERDIGQRLFDRDAGEVRATPAGSFLIDRARRLLFDARCLERDVDLYSDSRIGHTAFGVGPFPAATLMRTVLPELRRRFPQVQLRVEVSNWRLLLEHLRAETIEFFIADVRDVPADDSLEMRSLGRHPGGFYVRAAHPLAVRPCSLQECWLQGVAATHLPPPVKAALATLLGLPAGQEPALALECDDMSLLRAVALSTDTVLAATQVVVQAEIDAGLLRPLQVEGLLPLFSEIGVVSLRNRSPSPMARQAIELIGQVASSAPARRARSPASARPRRAADPSPS
jgi:DNA-binding transcriptional LysR family regulator